MDTIVPEPRAAGSRSNDTPPNQRRSSVTPPVESQADVVPRVRLADQLHATIRLEAARTILSQTSGFIDRVGLHPFAVAGSQLYIRMFLLLRSNAASTWRPRCG